MECVELSDVGSYTKKELVVQMLTVFLGIYAKEVIHCATPLFSNQVAEQTEDNESSRLVELVPGP